MFKFKLGRKPSEDSDARRRLHKDAFGLQKLGDRGFPSRPSSIAYDPQLNLIAIGTHAGEIRIYGQPGFQVSYHFDSNPSSIHKLVFLNGLARLLVLTIDGYLHLLEINNSPSIRIDRIGTSNEDDRWILKNTQAVCLLRNNLSLLIGLNDGNIYLFHIGNFTLQVQPITSTAMIEQIIVENCGGRTIDPGPVQSIAQHPVHDEKILMGYKNKLIVHWDLPSNSHDRIYIYKQEVESTCWYNQGMNFATSHQNGSYALWDAKQQLNIVEMEKIPYGPYPCTPMTKVLVKSMRNGDSLVLFSGGLPRSTYANKHSVSCLCENEHNADRTRHVTFDFTTAVIDFFTIDKGSDDGVRDDPQSLVVLLNEEIVVIDLVTDTWPLYHLPYLNSIHASPVICMMLTCHVHQEFYEKLIAYAATQFEDCSDRKWPITGGELVNGENKSQEKQLLLTGHEDGSVQFWDVTNLSMPLIYKLKTSDYFQVEQAPNEDVDEETWPPFRKTGLYDPYCDDPRLAIQKLALCTSTHTLIAAGTAGQILTFQFTAEPADVQITPTTVNLLDGCESFVWKGHEEMRTKSTFVPPGLAVVSFVQLYPPAAVSALALCSDIQSYAVGTAHGFTLINYQQNRALMAKCTLDPSAIVNPPVLQSFTGASIMTRGRSLKKSLRESFRRLRKGRTVNRTTLASRIDENLPFALTTTTTTTTHADEILRVPVERQVEFREFKQTEDQIISMVRCFYFARTHLNSAHDQTRSLWVGTNGGHVFVYSIVGFESQLTRGAAIGRDQPSTCSLAKEIRLKHKAPVLSIVVLDGLNQSIGQSSSIPTVGATSMTPPSHTTADNSSSNTLAAHKVLICSEEQFKIFTLPALKPFGKFKLTATEGTRVRKITINQFTHKTDHTPESCLVCLDNMGQISIYSLPTLRRQTVFNCIKANDINALSSLQFSPSAHAFYLQSSSELAQVTFSLEAPLPYPVTITYDKLQRTAIHRSDLEKSPARSNLKTIEVNQQPATPSDGTRREIREESVSVSSPPNSVQSETENDESLSSKTNTMTTVKSYQNGNHSGLSANSDIAIDFDSGITSMNDTHPSSQEAHRSVDEGVSSTPLEVVTDVSKLVGTNGHQPSISTVSPSKKGAAPPPPPPPKPAKLISVKIRQAPTINEVHCFNGSSKPSSSGSPASPAIHT